MTKRGHRKTGVGLALCGAAIAMVASYSPAQSGMIAMVAMLSSSLPDTLEIKWWRTGQRHSMIPHRTLTHWLLPWVIAAIWLIWDMQHQQFVSLFVLLVNVFLLGVAFGGIGHILMDWMTPMGVPVILPFGKHSLYLFKSGNPVIESAVAFVTFSVGVASLLFVLHLPSF